MTKIQHVLFKYLHFLTIAVPLTFFSFKMKVALSLERSGIYYLGVGCILTKFSYCKVSSLFLALL